MWEYDKIEGGIKDGDIITLVNGCRVKLVGDIFTITTPKGYDTHYTTDYFRSSYTMDLECLVDPTIQSKRVRPKTTDYNVVKVERDGQIIWSRT